MLSGFVRSVAVDEPWARRIGLVARGLADPGGTRRSLSTHCEVAAMLARRAGLEESVVHALGHAYERWDGKGYPAGLRGDAIPLAVRIVVVARDVDLAGIVGEDPRTWVTSRRGKAYDPSVVDAFELAAAELTAGLGEDERDAALAVSPSPWRRSARAGSTRSSRRSRTSPISSRPGFAATRASSRRWPRRQAGTRGSTRTMYRAATRGPRARRRPRRRRERHLGQAGPTHHHRVGARAASPVLHRANPARCPMLATLVQPASAHHERLDGSGYHRSLAGGALSRGDRLLAAADVFSALAADRPHRPARADDDAARALEAEPGLDADAVACALAAAGRRVPPHHRAGRPISPTGRSRCCA